MTASYKYKESALSLNSKLNSDVFKSLSLKELKETILLTDVTVYKKTTIMKILSKIVDQFSIV